MTRQQANLKILMILTKAVNEFPDQRFGQLLRNLEACTEARDETGAVTHWLNSFNDESVYTLSKLENSEMGMYIAGLDKK